MHKGLIALAWLAGLVGCTRSGSTDEEPAPATVPEAVEPAVSKVDPPPEVEPRPDATAKQEARSDSPSQERLAEDEGPAEEETPAEIVIAEHRVGATVPLFQREGRSVGSLLFGAVSPVSGADLRDPGTIAKKLGAAPTMFRGTLTYRVGGDPVFELSMGDDSVSGRLVDARVQTMDGVKVGMSFAALLEQVPKPTCTFEGGAGGELVVCELQHGLQAAFRSTHDGFYDLPRPPSDDDVREAVGKASVESISFHATGAAAPERPAPLPDPGIDAVLPAGVYWHPYSPCDLRRAPKHCIDPSHAVIDGTYDVEAARERLPTLSREGLAPGYPLVVHTDELGISEGHPGVVLVWGLFASEAAARRWQGDHRPDAKLVAVDVRDKGDDAREQQHVVVRIRPGRGVPAMRGGKPGCKLREHDFFVEKSVTMEDLRIEGGDFELRCPDGKPASVRRQDTLFEATYGTTDTGTPALWQLDMVECDAGIFKRWKLDARGIPTGRPQTISHDC